MSPSEKAPLLSSSGLEAGPVNVQHDEGYTSRRGLWHRFGAFIVKPW
jgi:hypothetical protein